VICTSGFVDDVIFHTMNLWRVMCYPKQREPNSQNHRIDSNRISLSDKDQQIHVAPGVKTAIYDFLVAVWCQYSLMV